MRIALKIILVFALVSAVCAAHFSVRKRRPLNRLKGCAKINVNLSPKYPLEKRTMTEPMSRSAYGAAIRYFPPHTYWPDLVC
jgi:hypothetical protein